VFLFRNAVCIPWKGLTSLNAEVHHPWEEAYRAAMIETDQGKLVDKIEAANVVLSERLLEIGSSSDQTKEREQLTDALVTLDMIRRLELKIPA
jgi:hypothetical protein